MFGGKLEPSHVENVARTDGRARCEMFNVVRLGKEGVDQKQTVEETRVSTAVINGAGEEAVDLEYFDIVKWGNLWKGKCFRLEGLGHGPFWEDFGKFEPILKEGAASAS